MIDFVSARHCGKQEESPSKTRYPEVGEEFEAHRNGRDVRARAVLPELQHLGNEAHGMSEREGGGSTRRRLPQRRARARGSRRGRARSRRERVPRPVSPPNKVPKFLRLAALFFGSPRQVGLDRLPALRKPSRNWRWHTSTTTRGIGQCRYPRLSESCTAVPSSTSGVGPPLPTVPIRVASTGRLWPGEAVKSSAERCSIEEFARLFILPVPREA